MKLKYDKRNILGYCVSCSKKMKKSAMRYRRRGNYCRECNARAFKITEKKEQIRQQVGNVQKQFIELKELIGTAPQYYWGKLF